MSTYEALLKTVTDNNSKFAARHTKEPEQQYLKRMLNELADLSDEQFDELPQDAQDWFNHAVNEELNKHKEVTPPNGFADAVPADAGPRRRSRPVVTNSGENEPAMTDADETEQIAAADAKAAKTPRKRAATGNGEGEPNSGPKRAAPFGGARGGSRKEFSVRTIRKLVIQDPSITVDTLMERATEAGETYSRNTVNLARNQTLEMIEVAKQSGHWQ